MSTVIPDSLDVEYPDSDGKPMAENTLQFQYIVTIQGGLDALYVNDPMVFVAGDNLWYPVEGQPEIRTAPDVYVVFGRPKGHRGSYKQWEEDDIAPQVVFEILSPGNRFGEMQRKLRFYERYGVEEYYVYDPNDGGLFGWRRAGDMLHSVPDMKGFVSPRLGVKFSVGDGELHLFGPDGRRFPTYIELAVQRDLAERRAEQERRRAEQERRRAAEDRQRAEDAEQRAERLAALLRAQGIDPNA